MHRYISFNHQIILPETARRPLISSAALYGKGVFSTVAIYRGKAFLWEKHWHRLNVHAQRIGVDLSGFSEQSVKNSLLEIIKKNNVQNGRARITFFDERPGEVWHHQSAENTSLLILTADFRAIKKHLNLVVSSFRINSQSPLANLKSCNYLENLLAFKDAREKGFDEALFLNEREEVVSASMANIFWVKNEEIFTSSLKTGCLAGTTREFIMENFAVVEKQTGADELITADEVFLASAGIGIVSVRNLENNCYLSFKMTENIQKFLKNFVKRQNFLDLN